MTNSLFVSRFLVAAHEDSDTSVGLHYDRELGLNVDAAGRPIADYAVWGSDTETRGGRDRDWGAVWADEVTKTQPDRAAELRPDTAVRIERDRALELLSLWSKTGKGRDPGD